VGFIRDLPHHLIASFKATLEEAHQADLLLHVADASNPAVFEQIASVFRVLEELHIEEKDAVLVLNKADAAASRHHIDRLLARYPNAVPISARTGQGLAQLSATVSDALSRNFLDVDIETGVDNGRLLAYLAAHGEVLSKRYHDNRVVVHCRMSREHLGRINEEATFIRPRVNGVALSNGQGDLTNGDGFATGAAESRLIS
jgi:GTP-binding protein HflX